MDIKYTTYILFGKVNKLLYSLGKVTKHFYSHVSLPTFHNEYFFSMFIGQEGQERQRDSQKEKERQG
jgi:hypothetical protein